MCQSLWMNNYSGTNLLICPFSRKIVLDFHLVPIIQAHIFDPVNCTGYEWVLNPSRMWLVTFITFVALSSRWNYDERPVITVAAIAHGWVKLLIILLSCWLFKKIKMFDSQNLIFELFAYSHYELSVICIADKSTIQSPFLSKTSFHNDGHGYPSTF